MGFLFSSLRPDKNLKQAIYLQLAQQIMDLIKAGTLTVGQRLPGSRELASQLHVHRKTIVKAYDELLAQGWLESRVGSGTFVAAVLPKVKARPLGDSPLRNDGKLGTAGFKFDSPNYLKRELVLPITTFHLDDGLPDTRIAPLQELSANYRTQLMLGNPYQRLGYNDPKGAENLRAELSTYLNETRGLRTTPSNVLITRGTAMGLYLASTALLKFGDIVGVTDLSWSGAEVNFSQAGATIVRVPSDQSGICIDALEDICKKTKLRMLYLTPHHHYPTTITLRADRRIALLQLADKYGFIIFEDDYDYDFHYENRPLLPLASADPSGMVIYSGSFSKVISPAFRVGYLVAPADLITTLSHLRRLVDRQGDTILENAIAELLQNGILQRHLRKSLRVYRQRRDIFCSLLDELNNFVSYQTPEGGMAVWAEFDSSIDLSALAAKAQKRDLYFSNGRVHARYAPGLNATRLGFASSNPQELQQSISILNDLLKAV